MELILIKDKKIHLLDHRKRKKKSVITISQKSWLIGIDFPFTTNRLASVRTNNPFLFGINKHFH